MLLIVVVCVVGLVFSLLAVFREASEFNQDVSNWNTGAVTSMEGSKCGHASVVVFFFNTTIHVQQTRVLSDHNSHVLFFLCCGF